LKTKALILAAGYATRLWPLTLNKPKPLLPVGGRPMIEHILIKLKDTDIKDVLIVTNSKFVTNFNQWKKGYKGKQKIHVVDDLMRTLKDRRGSIGDTIFAIEKKKVKTDLLVIAGDNIFDFDLKGFIEKSRDNMPHATIGLFDIGKKASAKEYGIVKLDKNSKVSSFQEKPKRPKSTLAAMCLYYFPKQKLNMLRRYKREKNPLDLAGSFIKWLSEREDVYGYVFKGRWLDIGDKKSLKRAQKLKWS